MKTLKYFSSFTGIGGLDFGLEKIGAECVGFSEIRQSSIDIYKKHYPDHKCFGDITSIDPEKLPDFDVFTGGFPCQSFSITGDRQGFKDRRGQMIFYIYDILMAKKPEFVVLENVKGIITHNKGKTLKSVFKLLSMAGYNVRIVLLNSSFYGSAQARERVLFICRREKDFPEKEPEIIDDTKRFRDVRSEFSESDFLSDVSMARLRKTVKINKRSFLLIGGYDKVNTLTAGVSSAGRPMLVTQEGDKFRRLTCLEAERLQNFPDGWTEGAKKGDRWFALGNAVNCKASEYLFTNYLKGLWW